MSEEEEKANGISVEDFKEKESLIGELVEREHAIQAKAEPASKEQFKDNQIDQGGASPKPLKSSLAELLIDFLREKAAADRQIRQPEFRVKQQEQESQQQMIKAMMIQLQQKNTSFLNVLEKLLNK